MSEKQLNDQPKKSQKKSTKINNRNNEKERQVSSTELVTNINPEIYEVLKDANLNDKQLEVVSSVIGICEQFSGPIPPPNILQGYEDIVPGSANRIIEMAENESENSRTTFKLMIHSDSRDSLLGVIFAFVISITCVIGGFIITLKTGKPWGLLLSGGGLATVIISFINGTRASWKDEKAKED